MSVPATRNGAAPAVDNGSAMQVMADVITAGDLARLTPAQRVEYYGATCRSLGINPLTKPFDFINLNGKLTLYATKGATDQLRALRGISVRVVSQETEGDVLVVTVEGTDHTGRTDTEIGAVSVINLRGDNLANARMKALTKAKRRLTLSMVGLGMLDESEIGSVPNARPVNVDPETGEIIDPAPVAGARPRPLPEPHPEPDPRRPTAGELTARPQAAQPAPQPEPAGVASDDPDAPGSILTTQMRRLMAVTRELPVAGEPGRDVRNAVQEAELRAAMARLRNGAGVGSRKDLSRSEATALIDELVALKADLDEAGEGLDPAGFEPDAPATSASGLPLVDAEPVEGD